MLKLKRGEGKRVVVDVVPLVDTLLAVFLFLALLAFKGSLYQMKVQVPRAKGKSQEVRGSLKVVIDKEGRVFINSRRVSLRELRKIVKGYSSLIIYGDERVNYGAIVKVLDLAREEGVENFLLAVRR